MLKQTSWATFIEACDIQLTDWVAEEIFIERKTIKCFSSITDPQENIHPNNLCIIQCEYHDNARKYVYIY